MIKKFEWHCGTNASPVVLTPARVQNLVRYVQRSGVEYDITGYISVGTISRGDMYILNQKCPGLTVKGTVTEDDFAIYVNKAEIGEGEQTTVYSTGMLESNLKWRLKHSVSVTSGIDASTATARTTLSGTTIRVAAATENAEWVDEVTIEACPSYDDWTNVKSAVLTVVARPITGVSLTGAEAMRMGGSDTITIEAFPKNTTKTSGMTITASAITDDGMAVTVVPNSASRTVKVNAPTYETHVTTTVKVYLYGSSVVFAQQDHVHLVAEPYLTVKVTGYPNVTEVPLTVIAPDGTRTEIKDGERMRVAGDGTVTYTLEWKKRTGYKASCASTVTPNGVSTTVALAYEEIVPGVFLVFSDGHTLAYETVVEMGYRGFEKGDVIGIAVESTECSFLLAARDDVSPTSLKWSTNTVIVPGNPLVDNVTAAAMKVDGEAMTDAILTFYDYPAQADAGQDAPAARYCRSKEVIVAGRTLKGYLPAFGELVAYKNQVAKVNDLRANLGLSNVNVQSGYWWSSSQSNQGLAWYLSNGSPGYGNKTFTTNVVPFYAF